MCIQARKGWSTITATFVGLAAGLIYGGTVGAIVGATTSGWAVRKIKIESN
jgi:hypothetical protein